MSFNNIQDLEDIFDEIRVQYETYVKPLFKNSGVLRLVLTAIAPSVTTVEFFAAHISIFKLFLESNHFTISNLLNETSNLIYSNLGEF